MATCECGCGQEVNPGKRFIIGHNTHRNNNVSLVQSIKHSVGLAAQEEEWEIAKQLTEIVKKLVEKRETNASKTPRSTTR
jgi:hypothetical protein